MQIHTIDLKFQDVPRSIATYLVVGPEGPVLVEAGPGSTLERLIAAIGDHDFAPQDIRHVLVTHIHLDHAGALGWWARQGAQVYVHERGAPHMIDPARLLASARRIYGESMDELWGEFLAVPAERLTAGRGGDTIDAAGIRFTAIDTPGHASHHHAYRLDDVAFIGDAGGIRIAGSPLIDVPSPPPEFDLEVWEESIDRLAAEGLTAIYPTHFGIVTDVQQHFQRLRVVLNDYAQLVRSHLEAGASREEIIELYAARKYEHARSVGLTDEDVEQYRSTNPPFMSVDGIARYYRKRM